MCIVQPDYLFVTFSINLVGIAPKKPAVKCIFKHVKTGEQKGPQFTFLFSI